MVLAEIKSHRYLLLFIALMLVLGSTSASFQRSDEHLYLGVLDLDLESNPNPELVYSAYAIVMKSETINRLDTRFVPLYGQFARTCPT